MEETNNESVENTEQVTSQPEETKAPMSYSDDGVIKVNLDELNKPTEEAVPETTNEPEVAVNQAVEEVKEEVVAEQNEPTVAENLIEEVTEEEIAEQAEDLSEEIQEAIAEEKENGVELPENIQKVVEFMNETGGSLEDYVKLNTDYSQLNEDQLLREYYESTNPDLDKEDIDFLIEDKFSYDEDIDEERDVRLKKLERKQALSKAKNHLDSLKSKYYDEIKAGSKLNPEQKKAVDFFNRYTKENEEQTKLAEQQVSTFKKKTENLFSDEFKGFEYKVGEKKFRFKVNNVDQVKTQQSDINNFVKKFLNDKNEMSDAAGYHKSLFTAMNPDAIANHFYEQGKADALKNVVSKAKNIDMNPRGSHENVIASNGWTVKSISGGQSSSKLKIRTKR